MEIGDADGLVFALIARIPVEGVEAFRSYESAVIPLLSEFGGRLQRRLQNADGTIEVHILSFPSDAAFENYKRDPRRVSIAALLEASAGKIELLAVRDVI